MSKWSWWNNLPELLGHTFRKLWTLNFWGLTIFFCLFAIMWEWGDVWDSNQRNLTQITSSREGVAKLFGERAKKVVKRLQSTFLTSNVGRFIFMNVNICCTVDLSYNLKINRYNFKQQYLNLRQVINDKNSILFTNLLLLLGKKLLQCSKRLEGHF